MFVLQKALNALAANDLFFAAVVPGDAATSESICRSLLLCRMQDTSVIAEYSGASGAALDSLFEFLHYPQWCLVPFSSFSSQSAIVLHYSRCFASGKEMLSLASKFVLLLASVGCSARECRDLAKQISAGMARGQQLLQNRCNVAEAAALSALPNPPIGQPKTSKARLKAISKRK